ncbi:hypothetical protein EB118_06035 [bacterium]|nr:hypothetical protein [bacterium]NDC93772.1 hypothetical protein [bacterium]NDD83105.1 hypothetical protein [bacterium]NDG29638.1 hypothetical protein [bacterium]
MEGGHFVDLFLETSDYLKPSKFKSLAIVVLVTGLLWVYYNNNAYKLVIVLVFAIAIANVYAKGALESLDDTNKKILLKLNSLQLKVDEYLYKKQQSFNFPGVVIKPRPLDALYTDAGMINFLYSIINLSNYNPQLYYMLLVGTNGILKIKLDISTYFTSNGEYPENTSEMFQDALSLRHNTINNIHDFVYTLPKTQLFFTYLQKVINRYMVLITRVTDSIHKLYNHNIKLRGINQRTTFVEYDRTKQFDVFLNDSVIPSKQKGQRITPHYI